MFSNESARPTYQQTNDITFKDRFRGITEGFALMDVFEAVKGRRSTREFKLKPIPEELLLKVLEAASYAPSAGNIQAWEFIVVKDAAHRAELCEAASDQSFIREASVDVVICVDQNWYSQGYGRRGTELYSICDASAAIQNLLLSAHALGLGSCWVGDFDDIRVARLLGLPPNIKPIAVLALGYPATVPSPRMKRPLADAVHTERYGVKSDSQESESGVESRCKPRIA